MGGNGNLKRRRRLGGDGGVGGTSVSISVSSGGTLINQAGEVMAGGNGGAPGFGDFYYGSMGQGGGSAHLSGGAALNNAGTVSGLNGIVATGNKHGDQ